VEVLRGGGHRGLALPVMPDAKIPPLDPQLVAEAEDELLRLLEARDAVNLISLIGTIVDEVDRAAQMHKRFAIAEAAWRLIVRGIAVPTSSHLSDANLEISVYKGDGNWTAEHLRVIYPQAIRMSSVGLGWTRDGSLIIRRPEAYLEGVDAGSRVRAVVREAIEAYRHGLWLATVILCGCASEAAWIETGLKLARNRADERLEAVLEDDTKGIAEKVTRVLAVFGGSELMRTTDGRHRTWLEAFGRLYADCRNLAAHEGDPPTPVDRVLAQTILFQLRDYLMAVYALGAAGAATSEETAPRESG
jgi:hypothetical protein